VASSSSAKSSSSVVPASSSSAKSSSSQGPVAGETSLTKHGSGSANQEVAQGAAVTEFYYTIAGATGATVTGLPDGVLGTLKGSDFYISGTVGSNVAPGAYSFTVTTTGATTNASKSGTITVTSSNGETPASSSSQGVVIVDESSSSVESPNSSETGISSGKSSDNDVAALYAAPAAHLDVSIEGRMVSVHGATRTVYLLDAQGKLVAKVQPSGNAISIAVPRAGSYLLRIGNELRRVVVR
jgi:pectate lyase